MRELEELRMVEPFETVILSSETGYRKPSTKMFEVVLQALEVSPDEAIFVGDSLKEDVAGAKAAGIRTLHYCPGPVPPGGPEPDGRRHPRRRALKKYDFKNSRIQELRLQN